VPRYSANLSFLFGEHATIAERIDAAATCGFTGVEYMFPYVEDVGALRTRLRANRLEQVLFNLPAGDFAAGERGIAVDPARRGEFTRGVADAVHIAGDLGCRRVNCLVGKRLPDVDEAAQRETLVANLRYAAAALATANALLVVEPLNRIETPGFFIGTTAEALALIDEVGHPNLRLQYDCYHAQRVEGNLIATIRAHAATRFGHVQIADSPARNEPGTGEIAYERVLAALDASGYDGWVGLEYKPSARTEASFAWLESGFARPLEVVR
jgi:hydroxypyruvate isomerase